jgi:hypothetical protein
MKLLATVPTVTAEDTGDAVRVRDTNFSHGWAGVESAGEPG